MLKNVRFGREIFTLRPLAYRTVDFEKLVSDLFHAGSTLVGRKRIYEEINEAVRIAPKQNNDLETFPYTIQKRLAIHQSDFTLQIPI